MVSWFASGAKPVKPVEEEHPQDGRGLAGLGWVSGWGCGAMAKIAPLQKCMLDIGCFFALEAVASVRLNLVRTEFAYPI